MFKLIKFSYKKYKLLSKIAALNLPQFGGSDKALKLTTITQSKKLNKAEVYIEELLALLAHDKYTVDLLNAYRKTFDDIRKIIKKLELSGANLVVKGHYIAVSSIAFGNMTPSILKSWDGENFKIDGLDSYNSNLKMAHFLIESFE